MPASSEAIDNCEDMQFQERKPYQIHDNDSIRPPMVVGLRDRIAHFTWPWFACTMSTGGLAVVLGNTPNRFPGLQTIGKAVYILDLALFLLFNVLMITRFILLPRKFIASLHHPVEGLFHGTYWVSVALILNGAHIFGSSSIGPWLHKALEICFWIYCVISFTVSIAQYSLFFRLEHLKVDDAVPAWIFPIYPLLVVGPLAGTIIPSQPREVQWDIFVAGILLQGLAWSVSFLMYSIYMQRLMSSNLPAASVRPGLYVSVGPAGYTAAGLFSLANQAPDLILPNYWTTTVVPDGETVRIIGILAGLFILLFAYWFFFITTVAVLAGTRKMRFTLNWWAFIFPNAGMTLATIQAGSSLHSPAINGIASALTILLVILWLFVAVCCARAVYIGDVMWPGKDEDKTMERLAWGWRGNRDNPIAHKIKPIHGDLGHTEAQQFYAYTTASRHASYVPPA